MAARVRWSALLLLALVGPTIAQDPAATAQRSVSHRQLIDALRDVHNEGAALFNAGDSSGCYRLFQGALSTIKPVLPDELRNQIEGNLAVASRQSDLNRRAFVLHETIESVRLRLHALASEELPRPRKVPEKNPTSAEVPRNEPEKVEPPKLDVPRDDPPKVVKPEPPKGPIGPPPIAPMPEVPVVAPPAPPTSPTGPPSMPFSPPIAAPPSPEPPLAPVKPEPPLVVPPKSEPVLADKGKPEIEALTVPPRPELPPLPAIPASREKGPPLFPSKP